MRADQLTVQLDNARASGGHVEQHFTNVQYFLTWNGVRIVPVDGEDQFFDNIEVVGLETFTAAQAA